jgi:hypothetical protein
MLKIDDILKKANVLASRCAGDHVPDNLLSMVLAHLRRHHEVEATLKLLQALPNSPFGSRTGSTKNQLTKLKQHVSEAISLNKADWEEAAWIVGWARRLVRSHGGTGHG